MNPKITKGDAEYELGRWLDQRAQAGELSGAGRVRGMPESPASTPGVRSADYQFLPPGSNPDLNVAATRAAGSPADAVIARSGNFDNIVTNACGSKSGSQASTVVIQIGEAESATITDDAVLAWRDDVFPTHPKLQRLIVVRNTGGVNGARQIVLDVARH